MGNEDKKNKNWADKTFKGITDFFISLGANGAVWQLTLCVLLGLVVTFYVGVHYCSIPNCKNSGKEYIQLNKEQMQKLNNLISNYSDTPSEHLIRDVKIIEYLKNEYNQELDDSQLKHIQSLLGVFKNTEAGNLLKDQRFLSNSFFWLTGNGIYKEAWLWSLIGVLVSLIYYVSIANSKSQETAGDDDAGTFNIKEVPSQVAKMFYAPACTIVLILGYHYLSDKNGNMVDISVNKGLIVFSFICGFFSGRVMKFLDRLKELILPIGANSSADAIDKEAETTKDESSKDEIPDEVFKEALEEKGQEWKDKFAPVESISIGKKKINGTETEKWCLQFNVTIKQKDVSDDKKIPSFIEYTSKDSKKYSLPTDVNGVGKTTNDSCYKANSDIVTGSNLSTKVLGISCSRKTNTNTGTIGLKVKKEGSDKTYLLSCYHVLCAGEIRADKFQLKNTDTTPDPEVVSPGLFDGGGNTILANVSEGFVDNKLDIAIAELTDDKLLDDRIYGTTNNASSFFVVGKPQVRQDYKITMVGRSSGRQTGYLQSTYANVTVAYPTDTNPDNEIELKGVLMACKMSIEGDSGAAVFDEKNQIIGVVFASNDENTYILPIYTILDKLQVNLA